MTKLKYFISITLIILLLGFISFAIISPHKKETVSEIYPVKVFVSILPQIELVEKIGGDKVAAEALLPPGFNPALYESTPRQIQRLSKAKLYIKTGGLIFEKNVEKKLQQINPSLKIITSSSGIEFRKTESSLSHDSRTKNTGVDPHTWLSPVLAKVHAKNILQGLSAISPQNTAYFEDNFKALIAELETLHEEISRELAPFENRTLLVFHPAFGYFTDEYKLKQRSIEIEGKEPTAKQIKQFIDIARKENSKTILVQKQFSQEKARSIANEIDGKVIIADPLSINYLSNLKELSSLIKSSFEKK